VTEIAGPFAVSLPAVMKHLDVLARAGLVEREKTGRTVRCRLRAAPMESAMHWLTRYERFWTEKLGCAGQIRRGGVMSKPQAPASLSSAGSKRRRKRSSAPGRIRRK
jgi:DNA-binding transcriptional ArsR family regulator